MHAKTIEFIWICLSMSEHTRMSDNSNNACFSGVRFICGLHLSIRSAVCFVLADNVTTQATNEPFSFKIKIFGISVVLELVKLHLKSISDLQE